MDLQPNKIDGIVKPITNTRISASEWNQLAASCMAFITRAGLTPDAADNQQLLNAFITIAQELGAVGANVDLSNLSSLGENHFVQLQNGVSQADADYVVERGGSGTEWYEIWKSGRIRQGGRSEAVSGGATVSVTFLKEMSNTNYTISFAPIGNYTAQGEANDCVSAYNTTGMTFTSGHIANVVFSWVIEGE